MALDDLACSFFYDILGALGEWVGRVTLRCLTFGRSPRGEPPRRLTRVCTCALGMLVLCAAVACVVVLARAIF